MRASAHPELSKEASPSLFDVDFPPADGALVPVEGVTAGAGALGVVLTAGRSGAKATVGASTAIAGGLVAGPLASGAEVLVLVLVACGVLSVPSVIAGTALIREGIDATGAETLGGIAAAG